MYLLVGDDGGSCYCESCCSDSIVIVILIEYYWIEVIKKSILSLSFSIFKSNVR